MMQYILQQPRKLNCLAIEKLGFWIALQGEELVRSVFEIIQTNPLAAEAVISRHIEIMRRYLDVNVPKLYHNTLVDEAMRSLTQLYKKVALVTASRCTGESASQLIIVRMIETLFTKKLTCLLLDTEIFRSTLCYKSYMLIGLTHLKLHLSPWNERDIIQFLKELHNIKYLCLQFNCTGNILRCLAENCKLIEELDVAYSAVDDNCVDSLVRFNNLRNVNLQGTPVDVKGIEKLLLSCNNIEDTGSNLVAQALEKIASCDKNAEKIIKLKTYSGFRVTSKQLELVVRMCPLIQHMHLTKRQSSQNNLLPLIGLQDLRHLKLAGYGFYSDQVKEVLQAKGKSLVDLQLVLFDQIDLNALMDVSQMCPNLRRLSIDNCRFIERTTLYTEKLKILPFRKLKRLTWDTSSKQMTGEFSFTNRLFPQAAQDAISNRDVAIILELWSFILFNCFNVEIVDFGRSHWLTEEIMLKGLEKNPLIYLKELRMSQSMSMPQTITPAVRERIVQNCISHPQVLVQIER